MENQKLLSNKDLLLKNLKEVVDNLKDCESYIADVLVSKPLMLLIGWQTGWRQRNGQTA